MCGIYGIVSNKSGLLPSKQVLKGMGKTLSRRGPDDQSEFVKGQAGLGATRLSIIDLKGGNQPLFNEDRRVWAVQNGEVYNYQAIKTQLEKSGHRFRTKCDTEVYPHLYESFGLEFVYKLRGMFACAIWDERKKLLVLARDRLGIKPLYYAQVKGQLIFASEIKAILEAGVSKTIDRQALYDYLSVNYVPGPNSIFTKIKKLPPAHLLIWKNGKASIKRYWKPLNCEDSENKPLKFQNVNETLLNLLEDSVKAHLVSDVPIGAFLSGGIDSSIVVALASKLYPKKLRTFSVGFVEKSFNELNYASQIAKQFSTNHHEIVLNLQAQELTEKVGSYFDEPFADSSALAVFAISQAARRQMKVVLTGDGGDEVFGGYVTYQADQLLRVFNKLPIFVREKIIAKLVNRLPASHDKMTFEFKAKRFIRGALNDPLQAHFLWKAIFTNDQIAEVLGGKSQSLQPTARLWQEVFDSIESSDIINKLMLTDLQTSLPDDMLTKVDRMSMANSLEVRVPLLDHKVVEFMANLPSHYKIRRLTLKWLLKNTLKGLLPQSIINRWKAGFHVPVASWLKHELKDMLTDYLSPSTLKNEGIFNPRFVQTLIKDHMNKKADYSRELWGLLMFSIWKQKFVN